MQIFVANNIPKGKILNFVVCVHFFLFLQGGIKHIICSCCTIRLLFIVIAVTCNVAVCCLKSSAVSYIFHNQEVSLRLFCETGTIYY